MFEEFYEMYEPEEQEVVALINRCIGGGYNNKGGFWQMTVVTLGMVFCDTGKVTTKEERLEWPVTDEERNSDKGWERFQNEQICRLVSFNQDKDLREAIARTGVKILGAKGDSAYFIGGEDAATRATDGSATAGRNYRLQGKNIKVAGTDPAVGIVLIDEKGTETKLPMDMIAVNNPSEVLVLLPADLTDGIYKLRLTTQYTSGNRQLKTPHVISQTIVIGNTTEGDGDIVDDPTA